MIKPCKEISSAVATMSSYEEMPSIPELSPATEGQKMDRPRKMEKRRSLLGINKLHFFAIVVVLTEAITDSIFNNVIYIFTYSVYKDLDSVPYLVGAYLEPSKHFCRVIVILYIPVLCLWRAGRLVVKQTCSTGSNEEVVDLAKKLEEIGNDEVLRIQESNEMQQRRGLLRIFKSVSIGRRFLRRNKDGGSLKLGIPEKLQFSSILWNRGQMDCHLEPRHCQTTVKQYNKMFTLYRKFPWKHASRLWGWVHQLELPVWLRCPVLRFYIWSFGCLYDEASIQDLRHYRNLSEFFRRSLRPGIRPIHRHATITSPADGTIMCFGKLKNGRMEQVKGVTYSLKGFIGPFSDLLFSGKVDTNASDLWSTSPCYDDMDDASCQENLLTNPKNCLYQCVIYLAPGDYHHFHSPANWTVFARRHFPGELLSVNPGNVRWIHGLFNFNERVVYTGRWKHGFFSMTAVGATLVGSINVDFDKGLATNVQKSSKYFEDASFISKNGKGVRMKKGQHFGDFNLGSTMVLLFEAPPSFRFSTVSHQKVKYGKGIGSCLPAKQKRKK